MEKQKNMPVMRFPEFRDVWETTKLDSVILKLESGVSVNSIDEPVLNGDGFGVLKTSCVSSGKFIPIENKKILGEEYNRAKLNPIKDSIIISRMNTPQLVGESGYITMDYPNLFIPDRLWMIRPDKTKINSKYLSIILASVKVKALISNIATGTSGSMKNISQPNFLNISVLITSLPEQIKIATFLNLIDERLTQLKQKKTLLEQYKKGVMQKIFDQEIRFKDDDGSEYPDWNVKTLGEIAVKKIVKNKDNNVTNVFTNSASQGIVNQRDFFDKDIANQNNLLNYYVVENNDFIYNPRISNHAPVGPISRNHLQTGVMSPLYSVFTFKQGSLDFFETYFSTTDWHEYMKGIANYGVRADRMSFSIGDFYLMPLPFPCPAEQTKIANFLSAIDEKMNGCGKQIEKTEAYKKGLLQQMFV